MEAKASQQAYEDWLLVLPALRAAKTVSDSLPEEYVVSGSPSDELRRALAALHTPDSAGERE
jgi:hypothetical protein